MNKLAALRRIKKQQHALSKRRKLEILRRFVEAGARHSRSDSQYIQDAHDACVKAGAMCGGGYE